jgi:multisubunit Na+/H+ antiporter MnhG subunit
MTTMNLKRTIGIVLALTGVLFSLLHIALLMFTDLSRRYHGSEIWAGIGFIIAIAGLLLLGMVKDDGK